MIRGQMCICGSQLTHKLLSKGLKGTYIAEKCAYSYRKGSRVINWKLALWTNFSTDSSMHVYMQVEFFLPLENEACHAADCFPWPGICKVFRTWSNVSCHTGCLYSEWVFTWMILAAHSIPDVQAPHFNVLHRPPESYASGM